MGLLEDMLKALDRVEVWKELQGAPKRLAEMENRVKELEEKLGGKWPGDVCRYCGARAARLSWSISNPDTKLIHEEWTCAECNKTDQRMSKPK